MYWRVQKISVEQLARAYGVYLVCFASIIFNLFLLAKMPSLNKLTQQQRADFDTFAREVTRHLTDSGFLSYSTSMTKLAFNGSQSELAPPLIKKMTPDVIPRSPDDMKAIDRELRESKAVSQVSIDGVKIGEPDNSKGGLVPIDVSGKVVKSSAGGVTGPDTFRFRFLIGMRKAEDPNSNNQNATTLVPVVADMQEMNGEQPASGQ